MILSKKNQKLLFSLVVLLLWIIFVPKEVPSEKPNKVQSPSAQNIVLVATDSAIQSTNKNLEKVTVLRVMDGDTIEIQNASGAAKKLRYIGINTPETVDPRRSPQCFGQQASARNKELVANKEVYLEKDVSEVDRYGRLLRYIYLDEVGSISVNEQLILEGFAVASKYPPDVKYQEKFAKAEVEARANQKGLWGIGVCPILN